MTNAIIGYTGFVGSTVAKQSNCSATFNSKDIEDIRGKKFDTIFCAGAPGQKWLANKDPEADLRSINNLIASLDEASCSRFVLLSTVDVFSAPQGVDENSVVDESKLQPYGLHRRALEQFVSNRFNKSTVVRLPALVGSGLRKNAIFDLAHRNQVERLIADAEFQFYPMHRLCADIATAVEHDLKLVHLTAEPIRLADIAEQVFNTSLSMPKLVGEAPRYDFRTAYGALYGKDDVYQVSRKDVFDAIMSYKHDVGLSAFGTQP